MTDRLPFDDPCPNCPEGSLVRLDAYLLRCDICRAAFTDQAACDRDRPGRRA